MDPVEPSGVVVPFDLDEDSVIDAVAVDVDGNGAVDVVAVGLDADAAGVGVVIDTDGDGSPDVAVFDLADDSVTDGGFGAGSPAPVPAVNDPFDLAEDTQATDEAGYVPDWQPKEGEELEGDSFTPPDEITNEDVDQAMQDVQHSQAMNQYMTDLGVID